MIGLPELIGLCEMLEQPLPAGVQGRSLWPLLRGQPYARDQFRSVYAELGFGGLYYGEHERPPLHFPYDGPSFDELNSVTQSGTLKMLRQGQWKLLYDLLGQGELYDLARDPYELDNRFADPAYRDLRCGLVEELLRWTIRTEDDLPGGRYRTKQVARNWQAAAAWEDP